MRGASPKNTTNHTAVHQSVTLTGLRRLHASSAATQTAPPAAPTTRKSDCRKLTRLAALLLQSVLQQTGTLLTMAVVIATTAYVLHAHVVVRQTCHHVSTELLSGANQCGIAAMDLTAGHLVEAVLPGDLHGVVPQRLHARRAHVLRHVLVPQRALARPLVDAGSTAYRTSPVNGNVPYLVGSVQCLARPRRAAHAWPSIFSMPEALHGSTLGRRASRSA